MIEVKDADDGTRLDRWFKKYFPYIPHDRLQKLLRTGQIRVNGGRIKSAHRLNSGQNIRIPPLLKSNTSMAKFAATPTIKGSNFFCIFIYIFLKIKLYKHNEL